LQSVIVRNKMYITLKKCIFTTFNRTAYFMQKKSSHIYMEDDSITNTHISQYANIDISKLNFRNDGKKNKFFNA